MLVPNHPFTVYYMEGCPYSRGAIELLDKNGINYNKVIVSKSELKKKFGENATFPRIFDGDGTLIGGHDDLTKMLGSKK